MSTEQAAGYAAMAAAREFPSRVMSVRVLSVEEHTCHTRIKADVLLRPERQHVIIAFSWIGDQAAEWTP